MSIRNGVKDTRTHYRPMPGWLWNGKGPVHRHATHRRDVPRDELWSECGIKMGKMGEPFPYPPMSVGQCEACNTAMQKRWGDEE